MKRLFLAAAVTVGLAALALPASASTPQAASGSGTASPPTVTSARTTPSGNTFLEFTAAGTVTGTFTGTFTQTGRMIVHPDGSSETNADVVFTGTVAGCGAGTVPIRFVAHTTAGVGTGHGESMDQADNTVGVHTNVDIVLTGSTFTYTGTYHC